MKRYYYDECDHEECQVGTVQPVDGTDDAMQTANGLSRQYEPKNLLGLLRSELRKPYEERGSLMFRFEGKDYDGIPMLEINPNKFAFEVDGGKIKSFVISDILVK